MVFYPLQALRRRLRSMRNLNPARIVVISFGVIILTGTLLLMLPWQQGIRSAQKAGRGQNQDI